MGVGGDYYDCWRCGRMLGIALGMCAGKNRCALMMGQSAESVRAELPAPATKWRDDRRLNQDALDYSAEDRYANTFLRQYDPASRADYRMSKPATIRRWFSAYNEEKGIDSSRTRWHVWERLV